MKRPRFTRPERVLVPITRPGSVPPHDLAAERAVLSEILEDGVDEVVDLLKPQHFFAAEHRPVFEAALDLAEDGIPVDVRTVCTWLRDRERLHAIGGEAFVQSLVYEAPYKGNIRVYAETVRSKWLVRQVIAQSQATAAAGYGPIEDARSYVDAAEAAIYAIAHAPESSTMQRIVVPLQDAFRAIQQAAERGLRTTGLPTGFTRYDEKTSGLHDGELTIIAARPGMGKTAFMMAIAVHMASPRRAPVVDAGGYAHEVDADGYGAVIFSLEMPREGLALRTACAEARVNGLKARKGELQPADWSRLTEAGQLFSSLPIWIDDTPGATLLEIRAKVRRLQAEYNREATDTTPERRIGLVAIDYLQLMRHEGADSREQEVSELSRGLKNLAKELNVPVIALSQLNRSVETRTVKDKRPQLSDLRESGAIEQDADVVTFIYRDEYYNPEDTRYPGLAEIIIGKQRNGPTGKVLTRFDGPTTRFDNLAPGECREDIDD